MKENPMSTERGGPGVAVATGVAEVVVGIVKDFVEEVIPDELKPKQKPIQKPSESLVDLMKMDALRAELGFLMRERHSPVAKPIHEPVVSQSVMPTAA